MGIPDNIRKLTEENDRLADAQAHAKRLAAETAKARWFERGAPASGTLGGLFGSGEGALDVEDRHTANRAAAAASQRLAAANASIKLVRTERLRALHEAEMVRYEAELNAMGLALNKYRA